MANDPFYGMTTPENTRRFQAFFTTNGTFGKFASRRSTIYEQPVDQAALERMREYVMLDLVCSGIVRADKLPPRVESPLSNEVRNVCANWKRRAG